MKSKMLSSLFAAGSLLVVAATAAYGHDDKQGDVANGKALYGVCAGCHGVDGMGNVALKAPRLAGQFDWYIVTQLLNFREGRRGTVEGDAAGAMMRPMASVLADEQAVHDVAAYIASLK